MIRKSSSSRLSTPWDATLRLGKLRVFWLHCNTGTSFRGHTFDVIMISILRASTTSSVLSTLDEKLGQLATQAAADSAVKEAYDKQYQLNVTEMQSKQKETVVKPLAPRPPPNPNLKSGPTAAGLALLAARNAKEAEKNKQAGKEAENTMDIDDENKGKR